MYSAYFSALSTPFDPHIFPSLKLDFSSYYVENFEVRVRVRSATGQKARVRAKCVRVKVVKCGVRACGQKSVTPNTLKMARVRYFKEIKFIKIKQTNFPTF